MGEIFPKCVYPPTQGFLRDLGKRKVKFGSKKAIFAVIWGVFEGVGPCLGISHPTHPHLEKISQKKRFFLDAFPNMQVSQAELCGAFLFNGSRLSLYFLHLKGKKYTSFREDIKTEREGILQRTICCKEIYIISKTSHFEKT